MATERSRDATRSAKPVTVSSSQCLLVLGLDSVLWAAPLHSAHPFGPPVPRPFLQTFLDYLLHPGTLYRTAIWTRMPRSLAISGLKKLDLDIFDPNSPTMLDPALVAFWGSEESGVSSEQYLGGAEQGPKDLDVLWTALNVDWAKTGAPAWSAVNSFLVDDVQQNTTPQPFSVVPAPPYSLPGDKGDTFLLELIGLLEMLATDSSSVSRTIRKMHLDSGISDALAESLIRKAKAVCEDLKIDVLRGKGTVDSDYVRKVALDVPAPDDDGLVPIDDPSMKQLECIFCEKKLKATFKMIQQHP